ncbi:MAG: hypothetical protein ABSA82_03250 [Thermacetogeniaceae bacterium]|jgi:hypothetical protein
MARRRTLFSRPRRTLYSAARTLGDLSAIQGQVGRRIARRLIGKATGRIIGRLFR